MPKENQPEKVPNSVSRRDFLKTSAAGALTTGLVGSKASAQPESAAAMGPGPVPITLKVNGSTHSAELEPRVTLLDALRNHLDVTGAKKVCDRATCGACTVLVGGKLVYACSMLAVEAQGLDIETVEGLGTPEQLHPIQAAFVEHDASQCGFCTPGFVLACKALLDQNPRPTETELRHGLGGNLCRCGTYAGIRQAMEALGGGTSDG